ncbi:transforming growth factor-beta-induced protein ig-h3-like [Centruroides sculpturatus]|uniref:transforming growth factor-beta-induced protein ig-h3-like n=1 Tax=Centruroides sculpturatus TaxID=218467 RepID=UPI000C6EA2C7|nr:transforming growth factor-beta-induced protein ig-h3-like [Centruroides sculpturatus]
MKYLAAFLLICIFARAVNGSRKRRFLDYFNPAQPNLLLNTPDHVWEDHADRIWRMNRNRQLHFRRPDGFFDDSNFWESFPSPIKVPDWFPLRPFQNPWPPFSRPRWEAVDVTGIGRTFASNDRPWWKGANVCEEKEVLIDNVEVERIAKSSNETYTNYEHMSECRETETSYICKTSLQDDNVNKTVYVKYECCHGFKRRYDGEPGCVEVDLKDLIQTIRSLALTRFLELTTDIGVEDEFRTNNFTVFVPNNQAFEDYERQRDGNGEMTITTTEDTKNMLTGHAIEGFHKSGDLVDERVVPSANGRSGIRTNMFFMPEKIITTNCVRVVSINNYAKNGVVHIVEKVLPQPTRTLAGIISSDPQFSILKGLLSRAGLVQTLRHPNGNFTLFAPTDSVFNDESNLKILEKVMDGSSCSTRILKHHLLPNVICTPALTAQARTINVLENYLTLSRNENDKLYVDGVQIVARDIVATNGVLHIIDGILLPDEVQTLSDALKSGGMHEVTDLIEEADLREELDKLDNFTFFVPTRKALKKMSPILKEELKNNKEKLRETLLYHIVPHDKDECDFKDNVKLPTRANNKTIRINQYGEFSTISNVPAHITAQCVRVIPSDRRVCGGVLHLVDQVLLPPKQSVMDVIEDTKEFSVLKHLLRGTGLDRKLREDEGPFTLFAPTDTAFYSFSEVPISELTEDWNRAERFLKRHILNDMKCCAGIFHSPFRHDHARTLEGSLVPLHRATSGWIWFGRARIHQCDLTAENGVVHIIDKVLGTPTPNFFHPIPDNSFRFFP